MSAEYETCPECHSMLGERYRHAYNCSSRKAGTAREEARAAYQRLKAHRHLNDDSPCPECSATVRGPHVIDCSFGNDKVTLLLFLSMNGAWPV